MSEDSDEKTPPQMTGKAKSEAPSRQERLAAQLRANLLRRKQQSRERAATETAEESGEA